MRPTDHFDAPERPPLGCCPCCARDLDDDPPWDEPPVCVGDGTAWCAACFHETCEHDRFGLTEPLIDPGERHPGRTERILGVACAVATTGYLVAGALAPAVIMAGVASALLIWGFGLRPAPATGTRAWTGRVTCAWCGEVLQHGPEPTSDGCCDRCLAEQLEERR